MHVLCIFWIVGAYSCFVVCFWVCFFYFYWIRFGYFYFFFSSRRRHTRCLSDWSSDVCSSDLSEAGDCDRFPAELVLHADRDPHALADYAARGRSDSGANDWRGRSQRRRERRRSEERRVGKECRSRGSARGVQQGHAKEESDGG